MKCSTYYFHMKTKIFSISFSVPLSYSTTREATHMYHVYYYGSRVASLVVKRKFGKVPKSLKILCPYLQLFQEHFSAESSCVSSLTTLQNIFKATFQKTFWRVIRGGKGRYKGKKRPNFGENALIKCSKICKNRPNFWEKNSDCSHFWVKFLI